MEEEFERTGANSVVSSNGFTVEARFAEAIYVDAEGRLSAYAEWGGDPTEIILYRGDYLKAVPSSRVNSVLANIERAMKHMGHRVQILNEGELRK